MFSRKIHPTSSKLSDNLTVALILGTSVPKGSKMTITAEMNVIAQK